MTAPPYAKGHMVRIALDLASPPVEAIRASNENGSCYGNSGIARTQYNLRIALTFFRNDKYKPSNAGIDAYECTPSGPRPESKSHDKRKHIGVSKLHR